ncbi:interferon gamma receptor 1-like isoform X1 [Scomber scombrus]|uniref:Interferon gamma receptor 1-like isoform X1 n=1 Tax=Scomber scombrus TaxID=13677 RepID=A0AAV1P5J7_SCOSC|nr:interferon gamma receptor 1-like [Scomber scombrus]
MGFVSSICVLVWIRLIAAQVPPPTNVTLHCRNLSNILEWTYEKPPPGLKFSVNYSSLDDPPSVLWVEPPTLQADVSFLSNPNTDYYLVVTAVLGQNETSSDGIDFSYFKDSQATQKCSLDFPPVNVTTASEDVILISFDHPWLLYHKNVAEWSSPTSKKVKRHEAGVPNKKLPKFECKVVIINQSHDTTHDCSCKESVCETKFRVEAKQETYCVKMTGELKKMQVVAMEEYCTLPNTTPIHLPSVPDNTLMYVGIGLASFVAFAFILYMVYIQKTKSSTSLPSSMSEFRQASPWTMGVNKDPILVPQVEPSSPTPLLPEKEVDELTPVDIPKNEYDVRMRIGVSTETDEGVGDEVGQQKDDYMQGTNLDEDGSETETYFEDRSSYERRQIVVELAPGEQAEGYRG